jgi:hypothetical protein
MRNEFTRLESRLIVAYSLVMFRDSFEGHLANGPWPIVLRQQIQNFPKLFSAILVCEKGRDNFLPTPMPVGIRCCEIQ